MASTGERLDRSNEPKESSMSRLNPTLAGGVLLALVGAFVLLFGKPATVGAQHANGISHWVKVGRYRINGDNIEYVLEEGGSLVIHFGHHAATQDRISLKGAEADAMRRWLDVRADDPMNAAKTT